MPGRSVPPATNARRSPTIWRAAALFGARHRYISPSFSRYHFANIIKIHRAIDRLKLLIALRTGDYHQRHEEIDVRIARRLRRTIDYQWLSQAHRLEGHQRDFITS